MPTMTPSRPPTSRDHLPDLTERLRIRRRGAGMRRWAAVIAAVGVLLVALAAAWVVRFSPALRVDSLTVTGTHWVSEDQVRAAAQVPFGRPLAAVDMTAIAQRVAVLGPVAKVEVKRRWPHTVAIEITERTAAYQRRVPTGYQWVDAQGVVFHTAATSTRGLVTVTTIGVDNSLLADVCTVIGDLKPGTRKLLASVDAATPDRIVLTLTDRRTIVWGSADQSELKSEVTQALLAQKGVTVLDVSSPTHPTAR